MNDFFTNLIGTLAVILVIAAILSGTDFVSKSFGKITGWKYSLLVGAIGGAFGIYANLSGLNYLGAVISVRDAGPMLAGMLGGPLAGLFAGLICGAHRLYLGGITAKACILATSCIGIFCGYYFQNYPKEKRVSPYMTMIIGAIMETFHLSLVLLMVKPFETAMAIVNRIAIPFILVNAFGFTLMVIIMSYIEQQRKLADDKARLESELEIAKVIQHSLLPTITEDFPVRSTKFTLEVQKYMKPAKKVGGDFYDFFAKDEDHFVFLIADVSGKGIPGALFMANAKQTLQGFIRDVSDFSQAVEFANASLCENNEAEMFVTAWIGVFEISSHKLRFISAGHNPPILIHNGQPVYLKLKNSFILAGMDSMKYKVNEIQLEKDDILYLYTDGVTEATNPKEELYGEERLLKCLSRDNDVTAGEIILHVNKSLNEFVQGYEQSDDITMLAIKVIE